MGTETLSLSSATKAVLSDWLERASVSEFWLPSAASPRGSARTVRCTSHTATGSTGAVSPVEPKGPGGVQVSCQAGVGENCNLKQGNVQEIDFRPTQSLRFQTEFPSEQRPFFVCVCVCVSDEQRPFLCVSVSV